MDDPDPVRLVGLIVNPVAGMGGSVGLKGTDGEMYGKALALGAQPVAPERTREFLLHVEHKKSFRLLVAPGHMGEQYMRGLDFSWSRVGEIGDATTSEDTRKFAREMQRRGADLIVFVGGDGTARDIYDAVGIETPVVAVPSGVKAYSAVFAVSARAAAGMLDAFVEGTDVADREVLDIDEGAFREGRLESRLYGYLLVPDVREFVQLGKEGSDTSGSVMAAKKEIGEYIVELMDSDVCYLLGPGTTVKAIADVLGLPKTLLGVDAVVGNEIAGADLNEQGILEVLSKYQRGKIIVTLLGGNGFIFGRGNKQFTPRVLRQVGRENIIVVATRHKIRKLRRLRVDTGDSALDAELAGYMEVTVGNRYTSLVPVVS